VQAKMAERCYTQAPVARTADSVVGAHNTDMRHSLAFNATRRNGAACRRRVRETVRHAQRFM